MKAIVITQPGGPEVLEQRDVATPEPGPEQIRVRVKATALNRADLLQRMGGYSAPPGVPQDIPGLEFAGVVDAVGPGCQLWKQGDRVFGIVGGGAYAEFVVAHERAVAAIPDALSDTDAAAIPEAFITAHDALVTLGGMRAGSRVLIHAVGSGVGIAAVQIARATNARVFGTARTAEKITRAAEYGLEHGVDAQGFGEKIGKLAGGGVDIVIDFVGASYLAENIAVLAPKGRLVVVGVMGGPRGEIDLSAVLRKRLSVIGTVMRSRPLEERIAATRAFAQEIVPLFAKGVLRPVIDRVMSFADIRAAHEVMASNANFGKIVVTW